MTAAFYMIPDDYLPAIPTVTYDTAEFTLLVAAGVGPCPVCRCSFPAYRQCVGPVGCGGPDGVGASRPCPTCPRPVPVATDV